MLHRAFLGCQTNGLLRQVLHELTLCVCWRHGAELNTMPRRRFVHSMVCPPEHYGKNRYPGIMFMLHHDFSTGQATGLYASTRQFVNTN
mmetsp:Transcript_18470/g.30089  ORF Transcript_18470/g.30089 Transcript_18470/m.30089 type:complete len:89 (-) Transcript_18470:980-1246(-)